MRLPSFVAVRKKNDLYGFQALPLSKMSESEVAVEEEHSMELFSDVELSQSTNNVANSDCKNPSARSLHSSFMSHLIYQ